MFSVLGRSRVTSLEDKLILSVPTPTHRWEAEPGAEYLGSQFLKVPLAPQRSGPLAWTTSLLPQEPSS